MMAAKGLAKLIEECGELVQVCGKRLAYYTTEDHPDGGEALTARLEDEIGDVIAACQLVVELNQLNQRSVNLRVVRKFRLFSDWHADTENNIHGIDARHV